MLREADHLEGMTRSLLAHRDRVRLGAPSVRIPDYGQEGIPEVEVPLDPALDLASQAKARFAKASRLRRTAAGHGARTEAILTEIVTAREWQARLASLAPSLHPAPREDGSVPWIGRKERKEIERALDELERRLVPRGLWPRPPRKREEPAPGAPLRFDLEGGWTLWAGRSGTENDLLTTRLARADDLWFHAAHVPGSHVILRAPGARPVPPPPALMERAAATAAWLSKLRNQEWAEVHWTAKRHVRKPRKAPPGTVAMEHYQVLRVRPAAPPSSDGIGSRQAGRNQIRRD
jgi:predicted ribosome quality control (RQC) complex YloA/Tae2 family protein